MTREKDPLDLQKMQAMLADIENDQLRRLTMPDRLSGAGRVNSSRNMAARRAAPAGTPPHLAASTAGRQTPSGTAPAFSWDHAFHAIRRYQRRV